jgi:hypothetical protein
VGINTVLDKKNQLPALQDLIIMLGTAKHLSEFQVKKFTYMFSAFFDIEEVKFCNIFGTLVI